MTGVFQLPIYGRRRTKTVVLGYMQVADDEFTREVLVPRRWYYAGPIRKYAMTRFRATVSVRGMKHTHETTATLSLHRVIYAQYHGPISPNCDIDHIDKNQLNNLPENLRAVSRAENNANSKPRYNSRSGYRGVSWCSQKRRWLACLHLNGKRIHLGYHTDIRQAADAVNEGYQRYYPDVQVPNPPTAQRTNT